MAFFEDLGKKLSEAGQTAVQKTKEMTDIAKLNSSISEEERNINNTYLQIGKLYVETHAADAEGDFATMIQAIKASEEKIVDYRKQIQDIKGVAKCENCGAEVDKNVAFCSSCGAAMPKPAEAAEVVEESTIKCEDCGAIHAKDAKFCTSCGKQLGE